MAMKWASRAEENSCANEAQKSAARRQKQDIVEFEQFSERIRAEAQERQQRVKEQQRREEEVYQTWKQNEMHTPVTGDYFVPRTGGKRAEIKDKVAAIMPDEDGIRAVGATMIVELECSYIKGLLHMCDSPFCCRSHKFLPAQLVSGAGGQNHCLQLLGGAAQILAALFQKTDFSLGDGCF